MNPNVVLGILYVSIFLSFVGLSAFSYVAQWVSANFGFWPMIGALAAYAGMITGLIWLTSRLNRLWFKPESSPEKKSSELWHVGQLMSYERQDRQSRKSLPIEPPTFEDFSGPKT